MYTAEEMSKEVTKVFMGTFVTWQWGSMPMFCLKTDIEASCERIFIQVGTMIQQRWGQHLHGYGSQDGLWFQKQTSYCEEYQQLLSSVYEHVRGSVTEIFPLALCIGTLVIAFKILRAIYCAETRGYVITSTKMTLLHLTKNALGIFGCVEPCLHKHGG